MQPSHASLDVSRVRVNSNKEQAHTPRHLVSGKVLCFDGSFPLEGVVVREKNSGVATHTRADGTWELELFPGRKTMEFELAGYEIQRVHLNRPLPLQVILKREYNPMQNLVYNSLYAHPVNR